MKGFEKELCFTLMEACYNKNESKKWRDQKQFFNNYTSQQKKYFIFAVRQNTYFLTNSNAYISNMFMTKFNQIQF